MRRAAEPLIFWPIPRGRFCTEELKFTHLAADNLLSGATSNVGSIIDRGGYMGQKWVLPIVGSGRPHVAYVPALTPIVR